MYCAETGMFEEFNDASQLRFVALGKLKSLRTLVSYIWVRTRRESFRDPFEKWTAKFRTTI